MTRTRLALAAVMAVALAGLLGWQMQRERLVKACLEAGGVWHGPQSACRNLRPILQRDLQRSEVGNQKSEIRTAAAGRARDR